MKFAVWMTLCTLHWAQLTKSFSTEITQDYIDNFVEKYQEFVNSSKESVFTDRNFEPGKYDAKAAINNAETYDFIIVGAGAAGSVIANRLSEIPEWKILLLEAGDYETPYGQIPETSGVLVGSKYNWGYLTEPQGSWCLGMIDGKCAVPTGKGLGGGTVINTMLYVRGNARDYDLWAEQGNDGWAYNDILPYFKKAENCTLPEFDTQYHQQGGPLHVEETQHVSHLLTPFLLAGKELGYNVLDYNGKDQMGFSRTQATTKHGERNSAAQSYLLPYKYRNNLYIKPLSHVIQIMFNAKTKEATGVKYIHNDTLYIAKCDKEVIVTSGPYNSPHLLMLSGIGPKENLEKLDIPVIQNLPVGKQLKDHAAFQGLTLALNTTRFEEGTFYNQISTWLREGSGPLAGTPRMGLAFLKTEVSKDAGNYPDVELMLNNAKFTRTLRIKEEYKSLLEPGGNYNTFQISIMPLRPKSTGTVAIRSKDPFHGPVIYLRQFSDPAGHDIETMVAGINKAMGIINTNVFRKLGAHVLQTPTKGCEHFQFASDKYWECAVRYLSISMRHQTGTCKMGPPSDEYAVVDNKLKVYGIDNLRVADSSVIPVSISGHTHAPSNMVGEKAADLIKDHWISGRAKIHQ